VNQRALAEDTADSYQFRYIELSDVSEGSISLHASKLRFAEAPSRARRLLRQGDVIISTVRPNLRGHALIRFDPKDVVCSTGFAVITPACPDDGEYLYQVLNSDAVTRQFHGMVTGTGYPSVDGSDVERLCIPNPTNPQERLRIGRTLCAWDETALHTRELLGRKEQAKRALMQHLLTGKRRFKEFRRPWVRVPLGELLEEVNRYVEWDDDTLYDLVSVRRRSAGLFRRLPLHGKDILTKVIKTTLAGDFVIAKMQVIHGAMAMTPAEFNGTHVSDSYLTFVARDPNRLYMPFLDYLSQTPEMYYKAFRSSYGVAIEKMTFHLKWFLDEKVSIPPTVKEQERIAPVLSAADREIHLLRCELHLLKKQKRGLMQKLLTGQIRVRT
jgi:type I restriction enzyme S subunit